MATVKKTWTGNHMAKKPDMVAQAKARGFRVEDDNEADALAILHWAIAKEAGAWKPTRSVQSREKVPRPSRRRRRPRPIKERCCDPTSLCRRVTPRSQNGPCPENAPTSIAAGPGHKQRPRVADPIPQRPARPRQGCRGCRAPGVERTAEAGGAWLCSGGGIARRARSAEQAVDRWKAELARKRGSVVEAGIPAPAPVAYRSRPAAAVRGDRSACRPRGRGPAPDAEHGQPRA